MHVIDFPIERRRPSGSTIAARDATVFRSDEPTPGTCLHERRRIGRLVLDLCPDSHEGSWLDDDDDPVDPAEALASLFGSFDLRAALPGVDAPGETVLVYQPDTRRGRTFMRGLPQHHWIQAAPRLWLTHDGENLVMSPEDRLLAENLTRDV